MPIIRTTKFLLQKLERFFIYRVMSLDDTPHRIALGVAIGIFITWTPTIGLQMALTVALAALLRANKLVGVPFVWISNPLTLFPIYAPNYWIGCKILGRDANALHKITESISVSHGWWEKVTAWFAATADVFWELWLGSLIVATVLGIITYFAVFRMIIVYRTKLHDWQEKHGKHHPAVALMEKAKDSAKAEEKPAE